MKAVVKINDRQYLVEQGKEIIVNRMDTPQKISFSDVMLVISDGQVQVGTPFISSVSINAEKIADIKGDKIRVYQFKAKSRYRKTKGFRPQFTKFKIISIGEPNITDQPAKKYRKTRKSISEKKP